MSDPANKEMDTVAKKVAYWIEMAAQYQSNLSHQHRKGGNVMYTVSCHNEWCNGPEHFANIDKLPRNGVVCPVCGWLALPGSGIKEIKDNQPLSLTRTPPTPKGR